MRNEQPGKHCPAVGAVHDCMVQTGTNWDGEPVFRGIFDGKMYRGVFDHVYYKILSLMVEKEMEVEK